MAEGSVRQELSSLKSYLFKTSQQLQWAFDHLQQQENQTLSPVHQEKTPREDPRKTFSEIKNLIIKSADIVSSFEDQIRKKLDGVYLAQSEFGTFREETSQALAADSQNLQLLFESTRTLNQTLEEINARESTTSAYIKTGCLQDGDPPVYGLEIGQKNMEDGKETFEKFARFTADRLSFFDCSDVEVAYISDYKLYITHAQVTGTLELGSRFRVLFDNGLAFQWKGDVT